MIENNNHLSQLKPQKWLNKLLRPAYKRFPKFLLIFNVKIKYSMSRARLLLSCHIKDGYVPLIFQTHLTISEYIYLMMPEQHMVSFISKLFVSASSKSLCLPIRTQKGTDCNVKTIFYHHHHFSYTYHNYGSIHV